MPVCPQCLEHYAVADAIFCPRDGARLTNDDAAVGKVVGGRYQVIRRVGEGGMGVVYEAEHVHLRRKVALKILRSAIAGNQEAVQRLQLEAQTTSALGHPNIVQVIDFDYSDAGLVYLVMEWLDGATLDEHLQQGPLDSDIALEVVLQLCDGLAEAHDKGIIHRDLKPANVFLTTDREGKLRVKILDFGIAKLAESDSNLTRTGALLGTPNYMSPEQASGGTIDPRTDVYSLGVLLYEIFTGTVPFVSDLPLSVLHQHTSTPPTPPSTRNPERAIPASLEQLILKCLAKNPAERPSSVRMLADALRRIRHAEHPPGLPAQVAAAHARVPAPVRTPAVGAEASHPVSGHDVREDSDMDLPGLGTGRPTLVIGLAVAAAAVLAFGGYALMDGPSETTGEAENPEETHDGEGEHEADGVGSARAEDDHVARGDTDAGVDVDSVHGEDDTARAASGWTYLSETHQLTFWVAMSPSAPVPGEPTRLRFEITGKKTPLSDAIAAGEMQVEVVVEFFKTHARTAAGIHALRKDGRAELTTTLPNAGKHHVFVTLRRETTKLASFRFDICVGADAAGGGPEAGRLCPRMNPETHEHH